MRNFIKKYLNRNEEKRIEWVSSQLSKIPKGSLVLDAGAGEMRYKKYCSHLQYKSQDFCQYDGKGNQVGLQTETWNTTRIDIVCDITSIPEANSSFDAILCTEVIEHISEPIKAIQEFSRLLRPGGTLILTAPFASLTHFAPFHFYSGFNKYFYEDVFKKNDLEILEITMNGSYFEFLEQEFIRLNLTYLKQKSLLLLPFTITGWIGIKILSALNPNKEFKSADLLCLGFQVVAKKKI